MELVITSPNFENKSWIPDRNSGYGDDVSPQLHIDGIDERAVAIVITMDDLGHPIQPGYNHWVAWNIPPLRVIPEHLPKGAVLEHPFHMQQGLAYGKHCYKGPKPPFNWKHEYQFTVYTLDVKLNISPDSSKANVLKAMEGHMLQSGTLIGIYQRKHKESSE